MDMTNRETEIQTESGQISSSEEMLCEAEPAVGTAGGLTAVLKRKFPKVGRFGGISVRFGLRGRELRPFGADLSLYRTSF